MIVNLNGPKVFGDAFANEKIDDAERCASIQSPRKLKNALVACGGCAQNVPARLPVLPGNVLTREANEPAASRPPLLPRHTIPREKNAVHVEDVKAMYEPARAHSRLAHPLRELTLGTTDSEYTIPTATSSSSKRPKQPYAECSRERMVDGGPNA